MSIEIRKAIRDVMSDKELLSNISDDQDFFEHGASSLTVVDMQIKIEALVGLAAETSKLLMNPTVDGWVSVYSAENS